MELKRQEKIKILVKKREFGRSLNILDEEILDPRNILEL